MKHLISKEDYKKSGIYRIKNKINSKIYIGSAIKLRRRFYEHNGALKNNTHSSGHLQKAYNKYGKNNFIFEVVELCNKDNLIEREQYWLDYYKTYEDVNGYNICKVAGNSLGYKHSEKTIEKMKIIGKRKPINQKAIDAMRKANLGKKKPDFAKRMSEMFSKPVIQLDLEGNFIKEWKSMTKANLGLGINKYDVNISGCANGSCKSARGFLWVKKEDYNPNKKYRYENNRGKKNSIPVFQYSLDNNFIKEWESGKKAADTLKINSQGIYCCIWGKYKTSGGYKWYKEKQ